MQIQWLEPARTDLRELFDYLLERNPDAVRRIAVAIESQVQTLVEHPGVGRPGRVAGTRELVIVNTPYVVAYTVDRRADTVIVLRVLHGARRWPEEL